MSNVSSPKRSVTLMNTYQLEPKKKFSSDQVQKIIRVFLEDAIDNLTYDPVKCAKLCQTLSEMIKDKVKEQQYDRYKIVAVVTIGEKRSQDVLSILGFLWDPQRDSYALYTEENMFVYIVGMCFGIYYE
ncbi:tctex1 domain-containing protein 1 [Agrilus planipennis]|uniref:Tctex1 domain-containing protein 1 n=1 Tax=Agrilus planipennis TaxID=224129 RepID=A0A1W4XE02_AGRPL|nr:tctex1 domain-containing protein 1 [Agrilus planipennis]